MFLAEVRPARLEGPRWSPFHRASPLSARLSRLHRGQYRVAYLYEAPDYSSFRYRVFNMIQALERRGEIAAAYFSRDELTAVFEVLGRLDTLVICRCRYTCELNRLVTRARGLGVRVLYDLDDLVFDPAYVHLLIAAFQQEENDASLDKWFAEVARIGAALKLCDAAISTTPHLAALIRAFTGRPVAVLPNFLNQQQIGISRAIYQAKIRSGFARSAHVHLGYFSGTRSHRADFGLIAPALVRLLARRKDVRLRIGGFLDVRRELRPVASSVEYVPFTDFVNLQRLLGGVELNLVPLQDNPFTNCKSPLKYFEAAIAGTLSIASPVFAYRTAIDDGVTGFLARDVEWEHKLDRVLDALGSYPAMAIRAYEQCEERFASSRQTDLVAETLFTDIPGKDQALPLVPVEG